MNTEANPAPPRLTWRSHPTDARKHLAATDMHDYVVTEGDTGTATLTVYSSNAEPEPESEHPYRTASGARRAAAAHASAQHQVLARALTAMHDMDPELRYAAGRGRWQDIPPGQDPQVDQALALLGHKDFDHPLFATGAVMDLMADHRPETAEQHRRALEAAKAAAAERRVWPDEESV